MSKWRKKGSLTLKDRDLGWDAMKDNIASELGVRQSFTRLKVGFLEESNPEQDYPQPGRQIDLVTRAFYAEYGTRTQKERPFMSRAWDQNKDAYQALLVQAAQDVLDGKKMWKAVNKIGLKAVGDIRQQILNWPADNKKRTVARKGFNKGLTESGQMAQLVTWRKAKAKATE